MKYIVLTLSFFFLTNISFSQIKKRDLYGVWKTKNDNKLFFKTDTIKFYQNDKSCHQIEWTLSKRYFNTNKVNTCSEPQKVMTYGFKEILKLKKTDFGQIIEHYRYKKLIEKFRIVELKKDITQLKKNIDSELKLIRFDKLTEKNFINT